MGRRLVLSFVYRFACSAPLAIAGTDYFRNVPMFGKNYEPNRSSAYPANLNAEKTTRRGAGLRV
jgi:hypothetical protein